MDGDVDGSALFRRGFGAMAPLWAGAIPVGFAYGVAAREIGLTAIQTWVMSLVVFSAAGQVSAVRLIGENTPVWLIVGTVLALNIQVVLLGLAIGRATRPSWRGRLLAGWVLTDGAYGIAAGADRGRGLRLATLIGAGASMYLAWNIGTVLGAVAGGAVPDPRRWGIDLVAPLTFLAVVVPLVRSRPAVGAAVVAGVGVVLLGRWVPAGVAILGAGLAGCAAGAWLGRSERDRMTA